MVETNSKFFLVSGTDQNNQEPQHHYHTYGLWPDKLKYAKQSATKENINFIHNF